MEEHKFLDALSQCVGKDRLQNREWGCEMKLTREELSLILGALNILRSESKKRVAFEIDLLIKKLIDEVEVPAELGEKNAI